MGYIVNSAGVTPALAQNSNLVDLSEGMGGGANQKDFQRNKRLDYSIDSNGGERSGLSHNGSNLYIP